jgi:hypothetical protein
MVIMFRMSESVRRRRRRCGVVRIFVVEFGVVWVYTVTVLVFVIDVCWPWGIILGLGML